MARKKIEDSKAKRQKGMRHDPDLGNVMNWISLAVALISIASRFLHSFRGNSSSRLLVNIVRRVFHFIMSLSINKWFTMAKNSSDGASPIAELRLMQSCRFKLIKLQFAKRILKTASLGADHCPAVKNWDLLSKEPFKVDKSRLALAVRQLWLILLWMVHQTRRVSSSLDSSI